MAGLLTNLKKWHADQLQLYLYITVYMVISTLSSTDDGVARLSTPPDGEVYPRVQGY